MRADQKAIPLGDGLESLLAVIADDMGGWDGLLADFFVLFNNIEALLNSSVDSGFTEEETVLFRDNLETMKMIVRQAGVREKQIVFAEEGTEVIAKRDEVEWSVW